MIKQCHFTRAIGHNNRSIQLKFTTHTAIHQSLQSHTHGAGISVSFSTFFSVKQNLLEQPDPMQPGNVLYDVAYLIILIFLYT